MDPVLTDSQVLHACPRMRIVRERFALPGGGILERPAIHHPGSVAIAACDDRDRLLLVHQFRYPLGRWTLEVPAGTLVPGEEPAACAARELEEETGWRATGLEEIQRFLPAPGLLDEQMILYRGSGLVPGCMAPDESECIEPRFLDRSGVAAACAAGTLADAKSLIALALLGWWPEHT